MPPITISSPPAHISVNRSGKLMGVKGETRSVIGRASLAEGWRGHRGAVEGPCVGHPVVQHMPHVQHEER